VPHYGVDIVRQARDEGQDDEQAGQKEDSAGGFPQVLLQPPAERVADRFFAVQKAKQDVMHQVRNYEHAAEDEDCKEPAVPEVKGGKGREVNAA
jgi:hypothetical protein